jgi:pimeloyl-ACP methyl ester carboxylesterase
MIDIGKGPPLVLVPGIQARWEWMRPAVKALSQHFRVLTFTLAGEPTSGQHFDTRLGFDNFVVQLDRVFEDAGIESAVVCGVSYGGLIAFHYAALRSRRVKALVLASALAPGFAPDERFAFYERAPRLLLPVFGVAAARRARLELREALPGLRERVRFSIGHGVRVLSAPVSPRLMIERIRLLSTTDFEADVSRVTAPTLVVTGDSGLDRVVPVEHTREYLRLLPWAEAATLDRTGHLGTVTRPVAFARLVDDFVGRSGTARRAGPTRKAAG